MKPNLIIKPAKRQGWFFQWGTQKLSSRYDPIAESNALIEDFSKRLGDAQTVIFVGCFPLYHISLVQKTYPHLRCYLFNDHPVTEEELRTAWERVQQDLSHDLEFERMEFLSQSHGVIDHLNRLNREQLRATTIIPSPYAQTEVKEKIVGEYLRLLHKQEAESLTLKHFLALWHIHTFYNLKNRAEYFIEGITLSDPSSGQDRPAIIISSGLSLDFCLIHHHKFLIEFGKKFAIICVPGIAARLLDLGIPITALFTTDAGFANTYHLNGINPKRDLPLIAPLSIHPHIPRNWKRVYFYWDLEEHRPIFLKTLGWENYIPADASVPLSAIRYLVKQGCNRIYTIGIDFTTSPFREHAVSNTTQEMLFSRNTRFENFTTLTHRLYHKKTDIHPHRYSWSDPHETLLQNQTHSLYQNQFQKIKTNLLPEGIEIIPIEDPPWDKYLDTPANTLVFHDDKKSGRDIYREIESQRDSVISNFSTIVPPRGAKEIWLNQRWQRI